MFDSAINSLHRQPDPHYPSVPQPSSVPPSLHDVTRVILSKGRPSGPVPRGSPLPHPAITAPMRYSSNRQKVLRFCGAMVSPGPTLSASRAAASADQPFWPKEAASRRGLSLARPRRQVARPFLSCHFPGEPASSQEWANRRRGHHSGRLSAANRSGTLHLRGGAGSQSDSRTAAVAPSQ